MSESEASETGNVSDFSHSSSSKTLSVRKQVQQITFLLFRNLIIYLIRVFKSQYRKTEYLKLKAEQHKTVNSLLRKLLRKIRLQTIASYLANLLVILNSILIYLFLRKEVMPRKKVGLLKKVNLHQRKLLL